MLIDQIHVCQQVNDADKKSVQFQRTYKPSQ